MKICLLARCFGLENAGVGRVAMELRDRLSRDGVDLTTMSVGDNGIPAYVKYSLWDCHYKLPDADVYHALSPVEGTYLPRGKSVVTFHDLIMWTHPERCGAGVGHNRALRRMASIYWHWCMSMAKNARIIVCVSDHTKNEVMRVLDVPEKKIRVIRSGINPDLDYHPVPHAKLRLGYLGQLDRRKRVDLLIKSFTWASWLDAELWIAGEGREREKLELLAGGDPRIKFMGFLPDDGLTAFYNSLDFLVFPSWIEGYGLPLVEAMACKVPSVILEDAEIPQEIRRRCLVYSRLNQFMFKAELQRYCLKELVDLDDNYKFAKAHDWTTTVNEYKKVYAEVLRG